MKLTSEMRSVAMQAESVEELLKLAEEYEYSVSKEEAEEIYAELNKEGELADEELENVAGGSCYSKDPHGMLIVTIGNTCDLAIKVNVGGPCNCPECLHFYRGGPSLTKYCERRTRYDDPLKK